MQVRKPMSQNKYLLTQSLISSWLWALKLEDGFEDFLKTLHNERTPPTKAMLDGIRFENVLNACLDGEEIEQGHEWYEPITRLKRGLTGSQQQVAVSRNITLCGIDFVLYGKLDYLKAGVIYDTKFSKTYKVGKYLDSVQHPFYFELVPEAYKFQYLVCDGKDIFVETYTPDEVEPITKTIEQFMGFLERTELIQTYFDNWKSKY
jgi:hypothetical protein